MDISHLVVYSFADGHLGCFHLLAVVNNTAIHVGVQISLQDPAFSYFGSKLRSVIAGKSIFHFLKNHHAIFHNGCSTLHSHQQCIKILISPHSCQSLLFFFLSDSCHPNGCEVILHRSFDLHFPSQRRWWHPTPVLLSGKSHGRRSLVGCSPWGR